MLSGIAGEDQGQGSVTCDIAGGAEAVLEGEDGHHQAGARVVKAQHAGDEP